MCKKLAQRTTQVQHDVQALVEAGANDIRWEPDAEEPLITTYSAKWAAATLLSRAFNLDIPTQSLNGKIWPYFNSLSLLAPQAMAMPTASRYLVLSCT